MVWWGIVLLTVLHRKCCHNVRGYMTLKQLEAFYWAATLGSFAIAADRLHITQSTLSKRIGELEEYLGCRLFDRSRKKASLTTEGERLVPQCRSMLDLAEAIPQSVKTEDEDRPLTGVCSFGLSELSASTWLPHAIDKIRAKHPQLVLEPQICLTRELERLVLRGEIDFAVIAGVPLSPSLGEESVAKVRFSWVASPRLALPSKKLRAEDFSRMSVLTHPPDSGLAAAFNGWLATHNLKVRRAIVCNSLTAITGLTVAKMGISFLPVSYVEPLLQSGRLVALESDPPLPELNYSFIWLKDDPRPIVQAMKKLLVPGIDFSIPNELWT